jgi:hypothetical protein
MEVEGEVVIREYCGRENEELELEMREENDNIELVVDEVLE